MDGQIEIGSQVRAIGQVVSEATGRPIAEPDGIGIVVGAYPSAELLVWWCWSEVAQRIDRDAVRLDTDEQVGPQPVAARDVRAGRHALLSAQPAGYAALDLVPIDSVTELDGEYVRIDAADHSYRVFPAGDIIWLVDTSRRAGR